MRIHNKLINGTFALCLMLAPAAMAQTQSGLVNVNLTDVKVDVAKNINVDVSQIPVTVQVPVGVAANVCDVNANVLAAQKKDGGATCDAKTTSTALNQIVQRKISEQNAGTK
ncbi:MAG TPA: hypothetical protein VMZ25_00020 [Terriglobales bacterium]|nr:hypothetical protein [Terriglobales bacterium]